MAHVRVKRCEQHNEISVAGVCRIMFSDDWTTWRVLTENTDPDVVITVIDCAPGTRIYRARGANDYQLMVEVD